MLASEGVKTNADALAMIARAADGSMRDALSLTDQVLSMGDGEVIAVTANVMKGDREKTLAAGCDGYITKPIDVDTLPGQIARFLQS